MREAILRNDGHVAVVILVSMERAGGCILHHSCQLGMRVITLCGVSVAHPL